jgi:hypothetical protein
MPRKCLVTHSYLFGCIWPPPPPVLDAPHLRTGPHESRLLSTGRRNDWLEQCPGPTVVIWVISVWLSTNALSARVTVDHSWAVLARQAVRHVPLQLPPMYRSCPRAPSFRQTLGNTPIRARSLACVFSLAAHADGPAPLPDAGEIPSLFSMRSPWKQRM